jgi:putative ABC transport system permease protein
MTWAVNQKLGVGKIMSGVLVMIILVLAAPYFSGGSTMTLLNTSSFFNSLEQRDIALSAVILGSQSYRLHILFVLFWTGAALVIMFAVRSGLATRLGLRLRYLGAAANPTLLNLPSRPLFVCAGLTIGNALVAIGGAVEAERRGGFTVNMGTGIILVAIAILLLGESILKAIRKREFLTVSEYLLAAVTGTFVYSIGVQAILLSGFGFIDLRLITALFLLCLLALAGRYHSNASKLF